jgi:hypothetical protein
MTKQIKERTKERMHPVGASCLGERNGGAKRILCMWDVKLKFKGELRSSCGSIWLQEGRKASVVIGLPGYSYPTMGGNKKTCPCINA